MEKDLMIPRYEVIAIYPSNDHFMLNEVIELNEFDRRSHLYLQEWFVNKQPLSTDGHVLSLFMYESTFDQYPHLFRKLQWWQQREEIEMPRYVKYASDGVVKKVTQWDMETSSPWFMYIEGDGRPYCPGGSSLKNTHWLPATEAEYQFQLSKEEKK